MGSPHWQDLGIRLEIMARRWQIIQKNRNRGIERTTTNDDIEMRKIVHALQSDERTVYIVVKDRVKNRRQLVWRRHQDTDIEWWILDEETPEIQFKQRRKIEDPGFE